MNNNTFLLDLDSLDKNCDEKLKEFAKKEELDIVNIVEIIKKEAKRIGESKKIEVTFETVEGVEDSFKVIVKSIYSKYKKTVIYPFKGIKSINFNLDLDDTVGKFTLYNNGDKNVDVTIDYIGLNLFSMPYKKVKDMIVSILDRKGNSDYIDFDNSICFKTYGVKINARKAETGAPLEDETLESIDIYSKSALLKEFDFAEQNEQIQNSSNIDIKENDIEVVDEKKELENDEAYYIDIDEDVFENENSNRQAQNLDEKANNELEVNETDDNILALEKMLEEEKAQQLLLEQKITQKLEELKSMRQNNNISKEQPKAAIEEKPIVDKVEFKELNSYISYDIITYKGIKEENQEEPCVYLGQTKQEIREYFNNSQKNVRNYDEMEMYDVFYAYYDEDDLCTGIGLYNQEAYKDKIALRFLGKNLITMKYRDIVTFIKENDSKAIEDEDGIISLKYGISIDPKEDADYENMICDVIHMFKKGYYDDVYETFY